MKLRVVFFCVSVLILSSCGSSKKASQSKTKKSTGVVLNESKPEKLPSVNEKELTKKLLNKNSSLNKQTLAYIRKYAPISVKEMHENKIPASITLAQGILESGRGRSELALKSNNHFGIKCHTQWQGERVYHDDDEKGECFRKYQFVETSYDDHSAFLTERKRYSFLFNYGAKDYKRWAKGLKKAGYATDKQYPNKLIRIIEDYKLYEFDKVKKKDFKLDDKATEVVEKEVSSKNSIAKYYEVTKGDTLYSIARKFNTTVALIKEVNGLKDNVISIGQHLLIQ
ncbi:glucosaminidase domain-containing protein [Polaribacter sp. Q13]|uniref:glucosaminidase domain-containing protein n=1 Tax=Polaribacter sp. Q13 TaxID=2806551 RepID=UPI00193C055C|nr:glucosaminidase domain-containing protein [Polaribacter sp. Q13]QVY67388.1 glucosaminidase domain-containing protein [Polaribacter sp. Q13]